MKPGDYLLFTMMVGRVVEVDHTSNTVKWKVIKAHEYTNDFKTNSISINSIDIVLDLATIVDGDVYNSPLYKLMKE